MIRIGMDEWCYHNSLLTGRLSPEGFLHRAADMGCDGIGIDYFMLSQPIRTNPDSFGDLARKLGLEIVFGYGQPFVLPGFTWKIMERRWRRALEIAEAFGSRALRVIGGVIVPVQGTSPIYLRLSTARQAIAVAKRLKWFCREAARHGIAPALENHNDFDADRILEIIDRVGEPNLKVTLDTGNPVTHRQDVYATVERLAPHAAYTHFKDMRGKGFFATSTPGGQGETDLGRVLRILRGAGYEGLVSIEVDLPFWRRRHEDEWARASLDHLKSLVRRVESGEAQ